ncbi:MAG: PHP domain-containing protein [Chloroflexi bacterium]|nr:PHP domain-containing protein [Chloroflexota bacterium]
MAKADLHLHTSVSDGMASPEHLVDHLEHKTDLDVIAVTDHEDAAGGHRAREHAAKRGYRLQVIVGAEITTLHGHLLALGIERAPRSFRSVEATLEAIHAQAGLAIVPHPLSWLTRSLSERTITRICARAEPGITFDAIELANPSPAGRLTADRAARHNRCWGLPTVGGSDAHHLPHAATGWTVFPGGGAEDLLTSISEGHISCAQTRYPSLREVGVGQALLGLAWGYAATPRKMLRLSRRQGSRL